MAADTHRFAALLVAGLAWGTLAAAALPEPGPLERPAVGTAAKPSRLVAKAVPTHWWHDGSVRRPLTLDATLEADFGPAAGAAVIRPAGATPMPAGALVSPVLVDDRGRQRALPGGVLVVLHTPLPEAGARGLLEAAGARPVRALGASLWLVEGPAGLGSLELANRLHRSGRFTSAQPNWWVARTLK